jgi:hypothetical protein
MTGAAIFASFALDVIRATPNIRETLSTTYQRDTNAALTASAFCRSEISPWIVRAQLVANHIASPAHQYGSNRGVQTMLSREHFKSDEEYTAALRDWFAGQVLTSAAALPFGDADCEHRARVAYQQADAMLAARGAS